MAGEPITELRCLRRIYKASGHVWAEDTTTRRDSGRSTRCHITMLVLSLLLMGSRIRVRAGMLLLLVLLLLLIMMKELLRHEPELGEIHVEVMTDQHHVLVLLLLRLGLDVQACDVAEDLTHAVELVDGFGDAAHGGEGGDEMIHAVQVLHVGCLDDMAEQDDEGDEWGVENRPVGCVWVFVRNWGSSPNTKYHLPGWWAGVYTDRQYLPVKIPNFGEMAQPGNLHAFQMDLDSPSRRFDTLRVEGATKPRSRGDRAIYQT